MTGIAEILAGIRTAAAGADRVRVEDGCAALVTALRDGAAVDAGDAREILELLRGLRYFRLLRRVADAFLQNSARTPTILRHYAQALVEQEELTAARTVLAELAGIADAAERLETAGLLGRVHKQMFVLSGRLADGRARHLVAALQAYDEVYRADERRLWHGVNVVALLARAEREGIEVPVPPGTTAASVAERVVATALAGENDAWDRAVAFEAQLALGDPGLTAQRLRAYLERPDVDAFMLAGTLRQLTEVWELTPDREPGATLLPPLRAALLREEGGRLTVDLHTVAVAGAGEVGRRARRLTDAGFHSLEWMTRALQCCRAVALIENEFYDGLGTGFLVPGSAFGAGLPEVLLLTNHHVIPGAVDDVQARVRFRGLGEKEHVTGGRLVWWSPTSELDAALLRLESPAPGVTPVVPADRMPDLDSGAARAFVIGHPEGDLAPHFSLENNAILDLDERRLQYSAVTLGGSSGSPVMDEDWRLIGLHHTGGDRIPRLDGAGTHRANEGTRLDAIVRAYRLRATVD